MKPTWAVRTGLERPGQISAHLRSRVHAEVLTEKCNGYYRNQADRCCRIWSEYLATLPSRLPRHPS